MRTSRNSSASTAINRKAFDTATASMLTDSAIYTRVCTAGNTIHTLRAILPGVPKKAPQTGSRGASADVASVDDLGRLRVTHWVVWFESHGFNRLGKGCKFLFQFECPSKPFLHSKNLLKMLRELTVISARLA